MRVVSAGTLQPGWLHGDEQLPQPDVAQRFLTAMSSLAATVTVISATSPSGQRNGMTATAVCSLSTEPPMLVACVNRSARLAATLAQTGWFTVNLLAGDQDGVAADFAGRSGLSGDQRFRDEQWWTHPTGSPVLRGAAASCVCHVLNAMSQATHLVVIGAVHDVVLPDSGPSNPLMYHMRRFTTVHNFEGDAP
jgi:flavin reductase (NADH)/flavin reductase